MARRVLRIIGFLLPYPFCEHRIETAAMRSPDPRAPKTAPTLPEFNLSLVHFE